MAERPTRPRRKEGESTGTYESYSAEQPAPAAKYRRHEILILFIFIFAFFVCIHFLEFLWLYALVCEDRGIFLAQKFARLKIKH